MALKFHLHASDHQNLQTELENLEFRLDYEKTDLGYKGVIYDEKAQKGDILTICDKISKDMVSALFVILDEKGLANGVGYKYDGGSRKVDRKSLNNNPQNWHGIAYNGMHLDAEGLK